MRSRPGPGLGRRGPRDQQGERIALLGLAQVVTMWGDWRGTGTAAGLAGFFIPPEIIWPTLALVGLFFLGAGIIAWVDRWRKQRAGQPLEEEDLGTFQALHEQGDISREELERIHYRLGPRPHPEAPRPPDTASERPPRS